MKHVFILSTGRTGTQFLARYFNENFERVLALHEPRPSRILRLVSNAHMAGNFSDEVMLSVLRRSRQRLFGNLKVLAPDLYIESNNFIYGFVDVLRDFVPDPLILHIIRDPRKFVQSSHNNGGYSGKKWLATKMLPFWFPRFRKDLGLKGRVTSIGLFAAKWMLVNRKLSTSGARYENYHLLRFEDIFDDEKSGLGRICQILDLEYMSHNSVVPLSERVNRGRLRRLDHWRNWRREQCRELHNICSPLMQEHSYGLEEEWLDRIQAS